MLRLRTLGAVTLDRDGAPLTGRSTQRKRLALLAVLAAARDHAVRRDTMLALLWPERGAEAARHALSQTLYALRQDLGHDAILAGLDDLRLNDAVTSDVGDFQRALDEGDPERGIALYGGPFLDGFFVADAPEFERWAEQERQRLARAHGAALERLADAATARGDHARAVELLRRRAAADALNGHVALKLMQALVGARDRAGALRHATVHAALLREELGVAPDAALTAFAERIRGDTSAIATRADDVPHTYLDPASVGTLTPGPVTPGKLPAAAEREEAAAPPPSEPSRGWRPGTVSALRRGGAIGLLLLAGVGAATVWPHRAQTSVTPRAIVLGGIQSSDTALGIAVQEVLRAELAAAPEVRLLGELPVRETLRLMALSTETSLTERVAVEVARRRGIAFAVVGAVVPIGSGIHLRMTLVDATTGTPVVTLSARTTGRDPLIPAVVRLATALRARVSASEPAAAPGPLPAVTTVSLPALQNYALARQALARGDRPTAIALLEAALQHDSLFALGHHLVGDLLWYVDQQRHAEQHLTKAYALSAEVPLRERLIIRARYEQVVRDRPDSALAYWQQLRASYPDEVQAYHGLVWTYTALGDAAGVAEVTGAAMRLDAGSLAPHLHHRLASLLGTGDTAGARDFARAVRASWPSAELDMRRLMMAMRGDWSSLLRTEDSVIAASGGDNAARRGGVSMRQIALLALGRLPEAEREMRLVVRDGHAQSPPRALLLQAQTEAGRGAAMGHANALASEALAWVAGADLSAPAVGRLVERVASVAAWTGDLAMIDDARRLVRQRDAGRGLPSYAATLLTIEACAAFARGDMRTAGRLAERSARTMFFGRSNATVALIAADAHAAAGDHAAADSLYALIATRGRLRDNDAETLWVLETLAARRLASRSR